ncbi:MAG: efflux RND transporter periplasmic adaptor subunit [Planctomycetia bacterium]|nr:efflux RND transporter periplasmic adaptor subunit [Planctomycetia bacterium]
MNHPLAVCCAILSLVAALAGCSRPEATTAEAGGDATVQVKADHPQRKSFRRVTEQPGYIEAFEQTPLYAKVAGYVEKLLVDIGDHVNGPRYDSDGNLADPGQVLVELSIPELNEERQQKKALVAKAGAGIEQAQAQIKVADAAVATATAARDQAIAQGLRAEADFDRWESEYGRIAELGRSSAVPQKVVDEAKNQLRSADAARKEASACRAAADAALLESQAMLDKARADEAAAKADQQVAAADYRRTEALIEYATIRAPFDGVVSVRNVDVGHFVQPSATGQDHPLLVVVHADPVRIFMDVPEGDAGLVDPGDTALIRVEAMGSAPVQGSVTRTSWALNAATRTLRAEIDVPNPDGKLRPGMYAYATVVLAEKSDALVLPRAAIIRDGPKAFANVVHDGKISRTPVVLGLEAGGEVEVASGVTEGDVVVLAGSASLTDGQAVTVAKPAAKP